MRVLIVGCGLGGLALALSLRQLGLNCRVLEQAPQLRAVGAGIQLSANVVKILNTLGLEQELARFGVRPERLDIRTWDSGDLILSTPLGTAAEARYGAPYYHAHRADLLAALTDRLGICAHGGGADGAEVELGAKVVEAETDPSGARVRLADGRRLDCDLLVGADGIHSRVRRVIAATDQPRFTGTIAWRGLTPADRVTELELEHLSSVWWGPDRSIVHYFVSAGATINWIGISRSGQETVESWSATGHIAEALQEFAGWHPSLLRLIEQSSHLYKMALYDRAPLADWHRDRVALLGDAAHAMLPFHAQGAAQSIEDAYILAHCLHQPGGRSVSATLARYQDLRKQRATDVQAYSRAAEGNFHQADPAKVAARNARLGRAKASFPDGFPPGQDWIYGYDADAALAGAGS